VIPRFPVALIVALLLAALTGCFGEEVKEYGSKPDSKELNALRAVDFPVYWLGTSFESEELSGIEISESRVVMRYGNETCDELGDCQVPPVAVWTYKDRSIPALSLPQGGEARGCCISPTIIGKKQLCPEHAGGAVLLASCDRSDGAEMYTGGVELGLFDRDADQPADFSVMAHQLLLFGMHGGDAPPLSPPKPLSCSVLASISPPWFRSFVVLEFRPASDCGGVPAS
jgi:hypothetical protein